MRRRVGCAGAWPRRRVASAASVRVRRGATASPPRAKARSRSSSSSSDSGVAPSVEQGGLHVPEDLRAGRQLGLLQPRHRPGRGARASLRLDLDRLPRLRGAASRLPLQADGVHAARGVPGRARARAPAEDPRLADRDGPPAGLRLVPRGDAEEDGGRRAPVRAADDGRQALQGLDRGRPGQGLRPRDHGRPRARRGPRQPARLRDRAVRAEGAGRHAGDPEPRAPGGAAGRDRRRARRKPPVVPRAQGRDRARQGPPPAGPRGRRLRSLPPLRHVQRDRRRADRAGLEGLPLQGAGAAPRGDHRHRAGQDLPVAPRDRPEARGRRGRRPRRSPCSTASASRRCCSSAGRSSPGS